MENPEHIPPRRNFIKQAALFALSFSAFPAIAGKLKLNRMQDVKPPLASELVNEFVRVAHFDLNRVKEMLAKEPALVNACWDWGGGDFEVALGGPSHIGNRDIANYLLDNGARKDIFCAAMLGDKELVQSFVKTNPGIVNVRGAHQFTLLYHIAISGDVTMAELIKPHLAKISKDCNQALHAAARGGHVAMAEWLLNNGVDNPNTTDFAGNTPLRTAEKKEHKEMALLIKKFGGT